MRLTQVALALVLGGAMPVAAPTQTVTWDVIASGGEVGVTSGGMRLAATVGQAAVGVTEGPAYVIWGGFWHPGLAGSVGGDWEGGPALPVSFSLSQNHPNPCHGATSLLCGIPRACRITVGMYDVTGRLIRALAEETVQAGYRAIAWDGRDVTGRDAGSGAYVCRMSATSGVVRLCQLQRTVLLIR